MKYIAPKINNNFVCVIDGDQPAMAAVISSYFSTLGTYFPIFEFPVVTAKNQEFDTDNVDSNTLSLLRASRYSIFLNNILARMSFEGNLILAGLSTEQLSFIKRYDAVNYIEITSISEIDFFLSPFLETSKQSLRCKSSDCLIGLYLASLNNQILKIDEMADDLDLVGLENCGIVVIENEHKARTVGAVNYAFATGAFISIVAEMNWNQEYYVQQLLQDWDRNISGSYELIKEMVENRVGNVRFEEYLWATFFTQGLPYSLVIQNIIPCTYVCIRSNPDFFVAHAILFEHSHFQGGAGVFSPLFFQDEETTFVAGILNHQNYFVKPIIGQDATVYNLEMHLKEFPYDIFHICSHGGEVKGNLIAETFVDRFGDQHVVEYEHVMSITPSKKDGYARLQRKVFFKKLDGLQWGSSALASKYPSEVYSDMHNAMHISSASEKKILNSDVVVANSSHIQCSDAVYQGMVETLSAHSSPLIFNNTCSSWYNIALPFIDAGVRGYIGTLCSVNTIDATNYSKAFYISAIRNTLMDAAFKARIVLKNRPSENIYVFWGLHFTTLVSLPEKYLVKKNIFFRLSQSFRYWSSKYSSIKKEKSRETIQEMLHWIRTELSNSWTKDETDGYFRK